jgi:hypothetical protein
VRYTPLKGVSSSILIVLIILMAKAISAHPDRPKKVAAKLKSLLFRRLFYYIYFYINLA